MSGRPPAQVASFIRTALSRLAPAPSRRRQGPTSSSRLRGVIAGAGPAVSVGGWRLEGDVMVVEASHRAVGCPDMTPARVAYRLRIGSTRTAANNRWVAGGDGVDFRMASSARR